ncbi:MAG: PilZ domain-containing protein [Oscillospiraceae bacterium]|nr:PilZ domain-containing protein [Oscillospiraceae bacterium]
MGIWDRKKEPENTCVLLDKDSRLLARGEIESGPEERNVRVRIKGGDAGAVSDAGPVQLVPVDKRHPTRMVQLILRQGSLLTFEPLRQLGEAVRQNFRMQMDFASFIYPKGGGRYPLRAKDLSCGGIAFYSAGRLTVGQVYEVVIPVTSEGPLLLDIELLRASPYNGPVWLYAGKFVDLIDDQETLLREAVYQAQIQSVKQEKAKRG